VLPTAVVFDYFGTLTAGTPDDVWASHAALSASPLVIPASVWRHALDDSFTERATGSLGGLESTFRTLARRCGVEPSRQQLLAACDARRSTQRSFFEMRPDAEPTLSALRAMGFRLGVLSDCTIELAEAWPDLPVSGLVDAAVFSCITGILKPDPRMYHAVAGNLGAIPGECLYVGDGGSRELTGALAVGMKAIMLRTEGWHADVTYSRDDEWGGPIVAALSDIPPLAHD
jgi:putative hydrolase of the HAD superfamily